MLTLVFIIAVAIAIAAMTFFFKREDESLSLAMVGSVAIMLAIAMGVTVFTQSYTLVAGREVGEKISQKETELVQLLDEYEKAPEGGAEKLLLEKRVLELDEELETLKEVEEAVPRARRLLYFG